MCMEWNRSETLALARHRCAFCHGLGQLTDEDGVTSPCKCVFRSIFRICYSRFREALDRDPHSSRPVLAGTRLAAGWSRKNEEYVADFYLVSRRSLTPDEWRIFSFHYLLGADWRLCSRKMGMERGEFFHECYRIQQKLGRIYRELSPYALFPLDEYFNGLQRREEPEATPKLNVPIPFPVRGSRARRPVQPPIARADKEPLPRAA